MTNNQDVDQAIETSQKEEYLRSLLSEEAMWTMAPLVYAKEE